MITMDPGPEALDKPGGARPERIEHPVPRRLARMRFLSKLLDNSILLPGGYRVGIDPLIGLIPGFGDLLGSILSFWLIYDAARLGVRKRTLARMFLNVLVETAGGAIPAVGDLFDAVWKANARNLRLVELDYSPRARERSFARVAGVFFLAVLSFYGAIMGVGYLLGRGILSLFTPS